MATKPKSTCSYCYGQGLYKSFVDSGMRRVMEKGPHNTPMHPREPIYACDVCKMPKNALPCPVKFVRNS
jgi:hypothetical protein